jgi:hypothetical protein
MKLSADGFGSIGSGISQSAGTAGAFPADIGQGQIAEKIVYLE